MANTSILAAFERMWQHVNIAITKIDYPVDSVNGKTGAVVLTASDVGAAESSHTHDDAVNVVKLWENSSPTSSFAAQTIALDLSKYAGVSICIKGVASGVGRYMSEVIPVGNSCRIHCHANNGDIRHRNVYVSTTGVAFEVGNSLNTENNSMAVPIVIYGWKGVIA